MRVVKILGAVVVSVLGLSSTALGQVPTTAAAATTGTTATAATSATSAAGAAGGAKNIWSFFCKTPEQKAQCKAQFCNSAIGQYINNMLLPASAMTGGLIGPCCPNPATTANPADLAKPATSAQGAAAKIKAEEAQAKAKIAAIEYLASVDCRYYPEAEAGMITGLRAEKNECVRLAAAKALASGCCCSPKVVKALTMSVNCSNKDGFPAEASELVRIYAFVALERCMRKCVEGDAEVPPEQPPPVKQALFEVLRPMGSEVNLDREIVLAGYFAPTTAEPPAKIFAEARLAVAKGIKVSPSAIAKLSGPRNVYDSVVLGSQWHPPGPIAATDGNPRTAPLTPTPTPIESSREPVFAAQPASPSAFAGTQTPTAFAATHTPTAFAATQTPTAFAAVQTPGFVSLRDVQPIADTAPAFGSQRVVANPSSMEAANDMPKRPGRGNLLNIFQDASRR